MNVEGRVVMIRFLPFLWLRSDTETGSDANGWRARRHLFLRWSHRENQCLETQRWHLVTDIYCVCVRYLRPTGGRLRHDERTTQWHSERRRSRRRTATTTATFGTC